MRIIDHSGDTLTGAVDGQNVTYRTSLPFDPQTVEVFLNGLQKLATLDDGFTCINERTVELREARQSGDTVSVGYELAGTASVGGQAGGVPPVAAVCQDAPPMAAVDVVPVPSGDVWLSPPPFCGC